jgi:hypothetical protein
MSANMTGDLLFNYFLFLTGFNKVLPDKEGGNFLFFTVYWGVQIYERVHKFCKLMKQIV